VKKKTADLQPLPGDICNQFPFSALQTLSSVITENVVDTYEKIGNNERKPWIEALGEGIARIKYDDEEKRKRIKVNAKRLQNTRWQFVRTLESIPYIDGTPVGTSRRIEVLWDNEILYVNAGKLTKRMSDIANELSRPFDLPEIQDSIKYCIDRSRDFVLEYFSENFTLISEDLEEEHDDETETTVDTIPGEKQNEQDEDKIKPETQANGINGGDVYHEPGEKTIDIPEPDVEANDAEEKTRSSESGKIRLIEKFALKYGFKKTNDPDRFIHDDGRWIQKSGVGVFHWEKYGAAGTIIQSYWIKEHILEKNELKLPADVWSLCSKQPDMYSLILQDPEGEPIEWSGKHIQKLINSGNLKLYPAEYRLSLVDEN